MEIKPRSIRRTAAIATLALAASGCGGGGGSATTTAPLVVTTPPGDAAKLCAPPKPATVPLSPGFPGPSSIVYTGSRTSGDSTIVLGYVPGKLAAAVTGYEGAFSANNFTVTKETVHKLDAELDFNSANIDGGVSLAQSCRNYASVTITITPR